MTNIRRVLAALAVAAAAACAHPGAGAEQPVPPVVALPDSLVIASTDAADSVVTRLAGPDHERYAVASSNGASTRLTRTAPDAAAVVIVRSIQERDARDALDEGVDALVTADPSAVAYAATRPDLVSAPMPWDRTYLLITPSAEPRDTLAAAQAAAAVRAGLASGAVRVEARPSTDTCWAGPGASDAAAATTPAVPRIVFDRNDAVASALAARLVALSAAHDAALGAVAPTLTADALAAEGVSPDDLGRSLAGGEARAYVVAVPAPRGSCDASGALLRNAPWSAGGRGTVVPLVDTRARVIARRPIAAAVFAWLGAAPAATDSVR